MVDWLQDIGIIGFWFFLIKGIAWIVLFFLAYIGVVDKSKAEKIKNKIRFFNKSKKND
jgi:hypothetical protein